tara:strand:- start:67 stop:384 length:318 start_codon:yes stop_codon:yes gene_type:complete
MISKKVKPQKKRPKPQREKSIRTQSKSQKKRPKPQRKKSIRTQSKSQKKRTKQHREQNNNSLSKYEINRIIKEIKKLSKQTDILRSNIQRNSRRILNILNNTKKY